MERTPSHVGQQVIDLGLEIGLFVFRSIHLDCTVGDNQTCSDPKHRLARVALADHRLCALNKIWSEMRMQFEAKWDRGLGDLHSSLKYLGTVLQVSLDLPTVQVRKTRQLQYCLLKVCATVLFKQSLQQDKTAAMGGRLERRD